MIHIITGIAENKKTCSFGQKSVRRGLRGYQLTYKYVRGEHTPHNQLQHPLPSYSPDRHQTTAAGIPIVVCTTPWYLVQATAVVLRLQTI